MNVVIQYYFLGWDKKIDVALRNKHYVQFNDVADTSTSIIDRAAVSRKEGRMYIL